jgi:flagellar biosynthetic protein FlhB
MADQDVKTEQPTDKRLHDAMEEGQFARTPDLQVVFILVAAFFALSFGSREYCERIASIAVGIFSQLGKNPLAADGISELAGLAAKTMLGLILPIAASCAGAAALAGGLQTHFRLTPKVLEFKLSRLDPMAGFQRLFSAQGGVKVATETVKLVVVIFAIWGGVKSVMNDPIFHTPVPANRLGGFLFDTTMMLLSRFILALGAIAAVNYVYQLRKTREDLMMTRHEVKEEQKQSEGDPKIKGMLRQMARRYAQRQMLKSVTTADVVVTNPTHFAVALKYERGKDKAPMVLAKGEGAFARRIKALAAEHDVPMMENKPVARMLFKVGRVGKPIPVELYQAVADILAFVYKTHRYYFHQLKTRRAEG